MGEYTATVEWRRKDETFTDNRYSRAHSWSFDGGATVPASSSPLVVKAPLSDPAGIDPEEAFVAAISSCHMLWFLSFAARKGFVVDRYRDSAIGVLSKDREGKQAITKVRLRPDIAFSGDKRPSAANLDELHHAAHENCFIANSVKTEITVESGGA
jgi:organic hydroperoxide reductase OsmC/OhrA